MKCGTILLAVLCRCEECLVFKEIAVLNGLCDAGQLLIYDAACTHI